MMSALKGFFYDWAGANQLIFSHINAIHGEWYDQFMLLVSYLADKDRFPAYVGILLLFVLLGYIIRCINKHGGRKQYLLSWLGIFLVMTIGFGANGLVIHGMKSYFAYPRPYVAEDAGKVVVLEENKKQDDDYHSLPSGHVAFATLMVIAVWPMMSIGMHLFSIVFVPLVMWSRVAVGMHFPADTFYGFLIALIIALIVQAIVYKVLAKMGLRC